MLKGPVKFMNVFIGNIDRLYISEENPLTSISGLVVYDNLNHRQYVPYMYV